MALDFSALAAATARNRTVDGSAAEVIRGIAQGIRDAIVADDLQDAVALNTFVTDLEGSTDNLAAAVSENTPAAPPA